MSANKLTYLRLVCRIKELTMTAFLALLAVCVGPALGLASARIAIVTSFENSATKEMVNAFEEHLKTQGTKADFTFYNLDKSAEKAEESAGMIKQQAPDLIFSIGSLATKALARAGLPVVAGMLAYTEFLENDSQSVTGVTLDFPVEIQFEWMLRFMPEAKNIGVLYNPEENQDNIEQAKKIAKKMGLNLVSREVYSPSDLPKSLEYLGNNADLLWGLTDKTVLNTTTAQNILLFSFRNRIPFVGLSSAWVKAGAFYALDRNYADMGKQCGDMALKILQGSQINSIKPEPPRKVVYSLNKKTAEQMKLELPESITRNAEKVY